MNGKPFKIRTCYFGREERDKPTLIITHGNMANYISWFRVLKLLSAKYRVVAFDNMSLGMSCRYADKSGWASPEAAEAWI